MLPSCSKHTRKSRVNKLHKMFVDIDPDHPSFATRPRRWQRQIYLNIHINGTDTFFIRLYYLLCQYFIHFRRSFISIPCCSREIKELTHFVDIGQGLEDTRGQQKCIEIPASSADGIQQRESFDLFTMVFVQYLFIHSFFWNNIQELWMCVT